MNLIEELYYGNIHPYEKHFDQTSRYAKAVNLFCSNESKLTETLFGEELKLFNDLVNACDEMSATNSVENFKLGFRLGVQLMCDSLVREDDKILKDITP